MLTTNEICERFYVAPSTVYRWKAEGAPLTKVGRKIVCEDYEKLKQWWKDRYEKGGK